MENIIFFVFQLSPVVSEISATMRLFGSVPKALSSYSPSPVCWILDGILGKSALEDRSLLGNRDSHDHHTEHQEYQAQNSQHPKYLLQRWHKFLTKCHLFWSPVGGWLVALKWALLHDPRRQMKSDFPRFSKK